MRGRVNTHRFIVSTYMSPSDQRAFNLSEMQKKIFKPDFYLTPRIVAEKTKPHVGYVYAVIYWFEKMKDGECFASNNAIAQALPYGSSSASVANALKVLENLGFIRRSFEDEQKNTRTKIECLVAYAVSSAGGGDSSADVGGITHRLKGGTSVGEQIENKDKNIDEYTSMFERFWKKYPSKINKKNTLKRWLKLSMTSELFEKIMSALEKQINSQQWRSGYIPHPSTWLNGERWEDEVKSDGDSNGGVVRL